MSRASPRIASGSRLFKRRHRARALGRPALGEADRRVKSGVFGRRDRWHRACCFPEKSGLARANHREAGPWPGEGTVKVKIRSWKAVVLGLALAVLTGAALLASQSLDAGATAPAGPAEVARGQYLVTPMDCAGCHTPGALQGQPDPDRRLAGSNVGFATAAGIV